MRLQRCALVAAGLVLALGTTACYDTASSAQPPKIGFVVKRALGSFAQEMSAGFREGARLAGGVEVTVTGPPTQDGNKEIELFKELAGSTRGGVAIAASEPTLIAPTLADAVSSGLPVVGVDSRPAPATGVKLHIGNDNYELGRHLADEVISRLPATSTSKIIIGNTAPGLPPLDQRAKGIRDQLAKKLPGVRVIGPFDTQRDPTANLDAWQRLVAANPDAVAFLGTGDSDGYNLADIRARTKGGWLAGGFGVDPKTLEAIKNGELFATVSPEHFLKGALAGWLLAEHATGRQPLPEGWIYTPGLTITSANLDKILSRQASQPARLAWFKPQIDEYIADPARFLRALEQAR
jgi:ribose transport system substrate-binding protein